MGSSLSNFIEEGIYLRVSNGAPTYEQRGIRLCINDLGISISSGYGSIAVNNAKNGLNNV